jgi:hypothetical protein
MRRIWGKEGGYTSHSDPVCILMHMGYLDFTKQHPVALQFEGIKLQCKVMKCRLPLITPVRKNYQSTKENGMHSRKLYKFPGNSLKPLGIEFLESLGTPEILGRYAARMPNRIRSNRRKLQPINVRSLTTIPETHIMFNLSCEPAFKYTLFAMCDRGEDDKRNVPHLTVRMDVAKTEAEDPLHRKRTLSLRNYPPGAT